MNSDSSLVFGSSGFIGFKVVNLLNENKIPVLAPSRSPQKNLPKNTKEIIIENFDLTSIKISDVKHVYICLGTKLRAWELIRMNKTKKDEFQKVDLEIILNAARKARSCGAETISLISAVGVKAESFNFYMNIKGRVEKEIIDLGFKSVNIFRPGHLNGKGTDSNWDVKFADFVSKIIDNFMIGSFSKFKSIEGDFVAKSMVIETQKSKSGVNYFYFNDMIQSLTMDTPST
ncbi:MAG: NAD-dependent epimerase/dehydratase family protein [Gammaproteobacteria bacterium]